MDYKGEFAEFGNVTYLDVAAQGPLPRASAQALRRAVEWKEQPQKMPADIYFGLPDRVRALIARMIGAKPEEVAITTGATTGLAAIAWGIDWKPEDEVLVAEGEFPAHFTVFEPLAERGWLRLRRVRPRGRFLSADDFLAEIGPKTRLVTTSLVRFHDGTRIDAKRLAEACHAAGAWLALDASQCAGAMPFNVRELGADFVTSAGYKWMLSPYGTGFFWAREERIAEMRPAPFYWTALPGAHVFNSLDLSPYRPEAGARRWDAPETASLNLVAMETSLEFLLRAGVETVSAAQSGAHPPDHRTHASRPRRARKPRRRRPPRPLRLPGRTVARKDARVARETARGRGDRQPARECAAHCAAPVLDGRRYRSPDDGSDYLTAIPATLALTPGALAGIVPAAMGGARLLRRPVFVRHLSPDRSGSFAPMPSRIRGGPYCQNRTASLRMAGLLPARRTGFESDTGHRDGGKTCLPA